MSANEAQELQELNKLILESHKDYHNDELQQLALQKSMDYVHRHCESRHLFCDKSMYAPSIHMLILFSFGENDALTWYKTYIDRSLNTCTRCISLFHRGRAKLKETFAIERGITYHQIEEFNALILDWEAERLLLRMNEYHSKYTEDRLANPKLEMPTEILYGIAECLSGPGILRANNELRELFHKILYSLLAAEHPFVRTAAALTPGLIYLMFEGKDVHKRWAYKCLEELYSPGQFLTPNQAYPDIIEEYCIHYLRIQNPDVYSATKCELYYRNIFIIFKLFDGTTVLEKFQDPPSARSLNKAVEYEISPLLRLLQAHIMTYMNEPLPYILRFFALILNKIGSKYWTNISPFTFQNVLETITNNPHYLKHLVCLEDSSFIPGELNPAARLNDLFAWISPFLETLETSQQQQTYNRLALFFVTQVESQNSISLSTKSVMFTKACSMVSSALTMPSKLYSASFRADLLLRSDARVVITTKLARFMDYATAKAIFFPENERQKNSEIVKASLDVIAKGLSFDVLNFAQGSYDIHNGTSPSTLQFSPELFKLILRQNFALHLEMSYKLLVSLENVSSIIPFEGPQKPQVIEFLGYLRQFFVKFSDIDPKNTKMILSNPKSLKGYWASIFSSDEDVYQSALDILYETFDAEGRLEGLHSLLNNNIDSCITAINENLTNLIFFKSYEPCPRAVKVLSDTIQSLNSPINGLFNKTELYTDHFKGTLKLFWNRCWTFLNLIYVETISWANKYKDLVEFTRDTLDLSHAVLACFKTINDIQKDEDPKKTFVEITNTFKHMLVWLRLSDPGLLASCVKLVSSTVDLAAEHNLDLDKTVIELLAKYGSRARKFNNKLTQQQSEEILERARFFDKDLVEKVINDPENVRKPTPVLSASSSETTPQPQDENEVEIIPAFQAAAKRRTQMKIDKFGSLSRHAPSAPAKKELPLSSLEQARQRLQKERQQKERVVHPAAPLGFNAKRKNKPVESSDEDDDSDEEDVHALFNLKKKAAPKKFLTPGITVLGGSINRPRNGTADEKKREEEYSRLRLNVDLKPLYKRILKWSYQREGDYPESGKLDLKSVADKFNSAEEYIKTFEPLLLLECWQAIVSARTREAEKPFVIAIASKSTVGDFFEVFISMTKTEVNEKNLTDSDLVVLGICENEDEKPTVAQMRNSKVTCLGKIHDIKYVKGERVDVTIRVTRSANLNSVLTPQAPIIMMRIMQMTTIEREYSSLHGLRYYNLSNEIFQAQPDINDDISDVDVSTIQKTYKVNESQAKAIGASFNTSGFTLVQGPPGTGKTKTILGIIGYMISSFRVANAIVVPGSKPSGDGTKSQKVLVCAPSNAAVDELVLRLKDGIMNSKGEKYAPNLVRLGRTDAVNSAVKDMTLEELVDAQLGKPGVIVNNMDALHKELAGIKKEIDACKAIIDKERENTDEEVYKKRRELTLKANSIKKRMDQERESQNSQYRNREINRRNLQAKILAEADIICSTLSGSAHDIVANLGIKFDSVIIDEACQCTELSAVIPLRYGCKRCIMVGDPNQLPPTVLSGVAADSGYDQSLFFRMAKNSKPLLLDVQYRMNSAISWFPSKKFYDGALKDGPANDELTVRPWHQNPLFPPYKFYDVIEGKQSQNSKTMSYINRTEVSIAIELVQMLFDTFRSYNFRNNIGIITPYKEQNRLLQTEFVRYFGKGIKSEISFNTIDGFQGQEKEIIIMSCVRADPNKNGVGFLKDFRRMNVALTRPKCSLWILGNHNSLVKNDLWSDLLTDAKGRNMFVEAREGFTRTSSTQRPRSHTPQSQEKIQEIEERGLREPVRSTGLSPNVKEYSSRDTRITENDFYDLEKKDNFKKRGPRNNKSTNHGGSHLKPEEPKFSQPSRSGTVPPSSISPSPALVATPAVTPIPPKNQVASAINNSYPSGPSNSNTYSNGPMNHNIYPSGPAASLPPRPEDPVASRSGTLPPIPTGPRGHDRDSHGHKKKRPQGGIFIQRKKRR